MSHHLPPSRIFRKASITRPADDRKIVDFTPPEPEETYTIRYYKNPFRRGEIPDFEWQGMVWDFVRKFAIGHTYPEGWVVIEESSGQEILLTDIGTAYQAQTSAELNS